MFYLEDDGSGNGDVNVPRMWDFGLNDYGPKLHIEYSTVTGKPRSALVARDVNRVRQMGL